jgi:hypothetical protein
MEARSATRVLPTLAIVLTAFANRAPQLLASDASRSRGFVACALLTRIVRTTRGLGKTAACMGPREFRVRNSDPEQSEPIAHALRHRGFERTGWHRGGGRRTLEGGDFACEFRCHP